MSYEVGVDQLSGEDPDHEWVGRLGIVALTFLFLLTLEDMTGPRRPEPDRQSIPAILEVQTSEPPEEESDEECTPRADCCRVCKKGKACGDSCIQEILTCHKEDGCACDEEDVCGA